VDKFFKDYVGSYDYFCVDFFRLAADLAKSADSAENSGSADGGHQW